MKRYEGDILVVINHKDVLEHKNGIVSVSILVFLTCSFVASVHILFMLSLCWIDIFFPYINLLFLYHSILVVFWFYSFYYIKVIVIFKYFVIKLRNCLSLVSSSVSLMDVRYEGRLQKMLCSLLRCTFFYCLRHRVTINHGRLLHGYKDKN